jgi:polar amino acid transport system substrate-binding protein
MKHLILTAALALVASGAHAQDVGPHGHRGRLPSLQLHQRRGEIDGFERELGDELCRRAN